MSIQALHTALLQTETALDLRHAVAAMRFLRTEADLAACPAPFPATRMAYCVMVRQAMRGHHYKADAAHLRCPGGQLALGLREKDEDFTSGHNFHRLGLYADLPTCADMVAHTPVAQPRAAGVETGPLSAFIEQSVLPDVVLLTVTPYQAMRIMQGDAYYQSGVSLHTAGNQAVCSECTITPYQTGTINLSMFCGGTRHNARWGEDEMMVGVAMPRFLKTAQGLFDTINLMEPNDKKRAIQARANQRGLAVDIVYDSNYFLPKKP